MHFLRELWFNGRDANYWGPVAIIIHGGVSFDTYKTVATSLMALKLPP
jgi:hypothetical protein